MGLIDYHDFIDCFYGGGIFSLACQNSRRKIFNNYVTLFKISIFTMHICKLYEIFVAV